MSLFKKVLCFLQGEMNEPMAFGWFHLLCIFLMMVFVFVLYKKRKCGDEKQLKLVLGIYGIVALLLEVLKQLIWSFNYDPGTSVVSFDYQWYAFPFQLCTTPIFVSIVCVFLKRNNFRNSLLSYLSYITILGSISTIIMPDSCFVSSILVNIHTMWLHLGSFVVSLYLLMSGEVKVSIQSLINAIKVFLVFVGIAEFMNIFIYNMGILNGEVFNMFYISPYFISTLPVFNVIQENVPYLVYLLIYIWALVIGGFIIYCIAWVINMINRRIGIKK